VTLSRNAQATARLFDALAVEYDDVRRDVGWDPLPHVDAAFPEPAGKRLLDVGCGTGDVAAKLVAAGASVVGTDLSVAMCTRAAERVPNTPFLPNDLAQGLPFPDASFDGVVALGCLDYLPKLEAACDELVRLLRPGGTLLVTIELCGRDCPGGSARSVAFLEGTRRYRWTWLQALRWSSSRLDEAHLERVDGFILPDGQRSRYARIIGMPRSSM